MEKHPLASVYRFQGKTDNMSPFWQGLMPCARENYRFKPVPSAVWSITRTFLPSFILPCNDFQSFARVLQLSGGFLSIILYPHFSRILIDWVIAGKPGCKKHVFWCFWKQTLLQIASRYNRWKSKTLRNRSRSTQKKLQKPNFSCKQQVDTIDGKAPFGQFIQFLKENFAVFW